MKLRSTLAIALCAIVLVGLMVGCSKSVAMDSNGGMMMDMAPEMAVTSAASDIEYSKAESDLEYSKTDGSLTTTEKPSQSALPQNQKLIVTMNMEAETENMDALLTQIDQKVAELGGYMEKQSIYNGSSYYYGRSRYADLTVRIPAQNLEQFVDQVSEVSNITSKNRSTQNITLTYVATQSRITALETEQTRLLELLAKAETMDDLLKIESRLTEVRTELEQVSSQLRLYDNLVDYSTVNLSIREVKEYTEVVEPETVWERISTGFAESMKNLGNGLTEVFVFFVTRLPYMIPLMVIAVIVFGGMFVTRKWKWKKQKQNPAPPEQPK